MMHVLGACNDSACIDGVCIDGACMCIDGEHVSTGHMSSGHKNGSDTMVCIYLSLLFRKLNGFLQLSDVFDRRWGWR